MAGFSVEIREINIVPHENADSLEIAKIDGFQSIVRKGQFETGDQCVYIPEQAIVPQWVLERTGLKENRIRPIRLRGVLSQGICLPIDGYELMYEESHGVYGAYGTYSAYGYIDINGKRIYLEPDKDLSSELGITKYEPPIPIHMQGEVESYPLKSFNFDVENIKKYPSIFKEGDDVVVTEKLHGTFCVIWFENGEAFISSKGLASKGLYFKDNDRNKDNLYLRSTWGIVKKLIMNNCPDMIICGEIFGKGVQDLDYGCPVPDFRIFDIYRMDMTPMVWMSITIFARDMDINIVPVLYMGPYKEELKLLATGSTTLNSTHIREGIVIRSYNPYWCPELNGYSRLKVINDDYLTRKNGTELN